MLKILVTAAVFLATALPAGNALAGNANCRAESGVTLQVLGSGGPIADDSRAGSAYLVWVDGKSRILVDVGSGAFVRFADSGARFEDLDLIGLSHFHIDHTADLSALLKSGSFTNRSRSLMVAGPAGSPRFPGLRSYMDRLLHPERGAYAYLGGYLDGKGRLPKLALFEVDEPRTKSVQILGDAGGDYQATALPISHGIVPALAYRIQVDDNVIVFLGDQDGRSQELAEFAADADVLVAHMPIPETAGSAAQALHATPSRLGQIASDARARSVVISHLMQRSLTSLESNLASLRTQYNGNVVVADDYECFEIHKEKH